MSDLSAISALVERFHRELVELHNGKMLPAPYKDFPRGACGDTSEILACFLESNGFQVEYVSGLRYPQWHAWLEWRDYIVDITAYQFEDEITDKIIITKNKSFHSEFVEDTRLRRKKDHYGYLSTHTQRYVYNEITKRIKKNG